MKKGKKIVVALLLAALMITTASVVFISANNAIETKGEMVEIKSDFESYLVQDTRRIENDGWVGAVQYTVYYDKTKGTVKNGYYGTPVIGYAINTNTERVGTDSNKNIIQSMLNRGYAVVVFDYLGNAKATGRHLDVSCQVMADKIQNGTLFDKGAGTVFPEKGTYRDFMVVPSGYNVSLNNVFWEVDKHSTEGTLEKIVQNWNTDFKGTKADRLVKWAYGDSVDTRKKVENAKDGSLPQWYNADGKADANGLYTKVKYTVAETFTDCVNPDGSPLETDMNIQIAYPTNPEKPVPVMSIASCWGYNNAFSSYDIENAHSSGSMFNGYAYASYDYLWVPMGRDSSFGYYDGNLNTTGAVTGDHMNYSVHLYNDKLINTAAMRYLRYLALSDSETYNFDLDAFAVIGLSKGGWFSFLGEEVLQSNLADPNLPLEELESAIDLKLASFTPKKIHNGQTGDTRYQAGNTASCEGGTYVGENKVDGGEKQPWLTYNGKEILSGVQFTYASNGSQEEDVSEGHSPIYIVAHMYDEYGAAYGSANTLNNLSRTHNIPSVFFETPQPHTYGHGPDLNYDVDTYDAFFHFMNYYLKGDAVKVLYVYPRDNAGGVKLTEKLVVKFAGEVTLDEILANVTVKAGSTVVAGSWYSEYGDTEWTFVPDSLAGNTEYTLSVAGTLKGKNGVALGETYTASFKTENDTAVALNATEGSYYNVTVPALGSGHDSFVFRFNVTNNAANVAELYAVESVGSASGTLLGKINLKGIGSYEIDITEFASENAGSAVTLYLKAAKASGETTVLENALVGDKSANVGGATYSRHEIVKINENGTESISGTVTAIKAWAVDNEGRYGGGDVFYDNLTTLISYKNIIGSNKITKDDYGRSFLITLRVYDTVSRTLEVKLNSMTNSSKGTMDYEQPLYHVTTKAGEWLNLEIPYVVYDTDYGSVSSTVKGLYFALSPSGADEKPIYIADIEVTETVTDINVGGAVIASKATGKLPYKAPQSGFITLMNGTEEVASYTTWKDALNAYQSGYTVKLNGNYTFTDSDLWSNFGTFEAVTVDLGGYTLYSENTKNSLVWAKNTSKTVAKTSVVLKNGGVVLRDRPLISYEDSSSKGAGKAFDISLENVSFTLAKNAMLTEMISASTINGSYDTSVNVNVNDCRITVSEVGRADHSLMIFPKGTGSLDVTYKIYGGNIRLDSQRWVAIHNNAPGVEFMSTVGGTTTLSLAAAYSPATDVAYLAEAGYADFKLVSTEDNIATFGLNVGANSTRYGVIPEDKMDAEKYPFVLFKSGSFVGAYDNWYAALNAWQTSVANSAYLNDRAELLMRRDYDNAGSTGPQINKATNLLLDFGGNTFTATSVAIDLWGRYLDAPYTTNIEFTNGTVLSKGGNAFVDVQHDAAGVKNYVLNFNKVNFAFASGATGGNMVFVMWTNPAGDPVDVDAVFTDCTFNLKDNLPSAKATVFPLRDGNNSANMDVTVNGGKFLVGNTANVAIISKNEKDSLRAGKGTDGQYPTLAVTGNYAPLEDNFLCDDGKNKTFGELLSTVSGVSTYALKENPLASDWGVLDAAYADTEAYPFAVFTGGGFVGAYGNFNDAFRAAVTKANSTSAEVQIVLRRDYTVTTATWANDLNGKIRIDLDGYTLTANTYMLDQCIQQSQVAAVGSITFVDGSLVRGGSTPMIGMNQHSNWTSNAEKKMSFTFKNLTIVNNLASDASWINAAVIDSWDDNERYFDVDVLFEDCVFDYGTSPLGSPMVGAGTKKNYTSIDITVKGGSFKNGSGMAGRVFAWVGAEDSLSFEKNAAGEETALTLPSTAAPITTKINGMYFVEMEDDGTTSTYYLRSLSFSFGSVSQSVIDSNISNGKNVLSAVDYPFMMFRDGSFKFFEQHWELAAAHAKDQPAGSNTTVVLRRDYDSRSTDKTSGYFHKIVTNFTLDLQGNTFNCKEQYLIDLWSDNTNNADKTLNFKVTNGNVDVSWAYPMMCVNHHDNSTITKNVNITLENLTVYGNSSANDFLIVACWDNGSSAGFDVNLNVIDCTIDLGSMKKNSAIFGMGDSKSLTKINLVISGGRIIANSFADYKLAKMGAEDSVAFAQLDGEYTALTQLVSSAAPAGNYKSTDGNSISFGLVSTSGLYATYRLGAPIETKYGTIPFTFSSALDYPFQLFTTDKTHIGGYADWGAAVSAAMKAGAGGHYVILMMRDANQTTDSAIGTLTGSITADLGGFTLTTGGSKGYIIDAYVGSNSVSGITDVRGTFTVMNGKIVKAGGNSLVCVNYSSSISASTVYNFNFDNVTFVGTSGNNVIFCTWENGFNDIGNITVTANATFNDCVFDYSASTDSPLMLKLNHDGRDKTVYHVTVKGGKIVANSAISLDTFVALDAKTEGRYDTLVFEKNAIGEYPVFELPASVDAVADGFAALVNSGFENAYVKTSEADGKAIFEVMPTIIDNFTVKTSITLWTEFVYNIYIPKTDAISSIKLGGTEIGLDILPVDTKDGESFYRISVSLESYYALCDISFSVTLSADGHTFEGSYTLSLDRYATDIINGEYTETEKTLAKDMLSYVRAAYGYFGKSSDKLASIDTLLGADYDKNNAPDVNKEAKVPLDSVFDGVSLYLGDAPSYRLYYSRKTAPSYTYTVGGREVEGTLGSDELGTYVEVEVYAYEMLSDLVFTDGLYTYTYNVYSYYEWASEKEPEAAALVERLVKYCESAEAYRQSKAE